MQKILTLLKTNPRVSKELLSLTDSIIKNINRGIFISTEDQIDSLAKIRALKLLLKESKNV